MKLGSPAWAGLLPAKVAVVAAARAAAAVKNSRRRKSDMAFSPTEAKKTDGSPSFQGDTQAMSNSCQLVLFV
jgi:hypothetical protein